MPRGAARAARPTRAPDVARRLIRPVPDSCCVYSPLRWPADPSLRSRSIHVALGQHVVGTHRRPVARTCRLSPPAPIDRREYLGLRVHRCPPPVAAKTRTRLLVSGAFRGAPIAPQPLIERFFASGCDFGAPRAAPEGEVTMRSFLWLGCGVVALVVAARGGSSPGTKSPSGLGLWPDSGEAATDGSIEVFGVTQCVPGRRASIAPVPLHPVVDVKAVPGDYVKKGQLLVKLDDDEARADVRAKQVAARKRPVLGRGSPPLSHQGASEASSPARATTPRGRAGRSQVGSRRGARRGPPWTRPRPSSSISSVSAVIDGVVSWLEVYPGLVSRPGTSLWGEIVDIRELDVRCEVTSEQADEVSLGEPVELRTSDGKRALPLGHVIYIAPVCRSQNQASADSGANPQPRSAGPVRHFCRDAIRAAWRR